MGLDTKGRTVGVGVACLLLAGCAVSSTPIASGPSARTTTARPTPPTTTKTGAIPKPDPRLTPGATLRVTAARVCVVGYSASVRAVPDSEKRAVFAEYGIASHAPYSYEVDHLISLELGGSNDIRNLWPEPYAAPGGARAKDVIENRLHEQVCAGHISLATAQKEIVKWSTLPGAAP